MPKCVVPGCTSGYASNAEKFHFFCVPKNPEVLDLWKKAVKRSDIKCGQPVCSNHFREDEILWQRQLVGADGRVLGVSHYKIPRLEKGKVPSIFAWVENADTTITQQMPATSCGQAAVMPEKMFSVNDEPRVESVDSIEQQKQILDEHEHDVSAKRGIKDVSTTSLTFDKLLAAPISLPPGWTSEKTICGSMRLLVSFEHRFININDIYTTYVSKSVAVKEDLSVQVTVLGKLVKTENFSFPQRLVNLHELEQLILSFKVLNICTGYNDSEFKEQLENVKWQNVTKNIIGQWQHSECRLLVSADQTMCQFCRKARKALSSKLYRLKALKATKQRRSRRNTALSTADKHEILRLRANLRATRISKKKAVDNCKSVKAKFRDLQASTARFNYSSLEEKLKENVISENQFHVLKQIIDAAKHENTKGRNYSEEWMLLCMLLHMRSASGYNFLRDNQILPLPCVRTIRRYLSQINATCGFDPKFFQVFKIALSKKGELEKHGILLLDEMSTRESISVNSKNLTYKGLIDFGNEVPETKNLTEKANHGLVLMFQPFNDVYTQPIAVFASRGPAKGDVLARLVIKAITLLEGVGAKVHAVVSDGASPNRKFWSEVGVSGVRGKLRNYFDHPIIEGRKIFLFSDTPHLLKTIRNRLYENGERGLKMGPDEPPIAWKYIKILQEKDREMVGPGQLLVCPKLTSDHVNLNSPLKMRVRLAAQVFSNSVAGGLRFYEKRVPELEGCEATASFCKWINDVFDALNRKNPDDGVKVGSADYKMIATSLQKLDNWEQQVEEKKLLKEDFLTRQTAEGFRVTLQSTLDVIQYLTQNCGFEHVLTGRINQDALERFFGTVRQAGGCNDHPSTPTFLNIYKILSFYSVLKPPATGNCSIILQKSTQSLVTLAELKSIYNSPNTCIELSESVKQRLQKLVTHDDWQFPDLLDHDYCKPATEACVLYCLTADLVKRITNTVSCLACKEALIVPNTLGVSLPEAVLTTWQQRSGLTHPNVRLYSFVVFLEKIFNKHCMSSNVFEETITEVLAFDKLTFPCLAHGYDLIYQVVQSFILKRMQQHCRTMAAQQQKTNQMRKKVSKFCHS